MLEATLEDGLTTVVEGLTLPVVLDHAPFVEVRERLEGQAAECASNLEDLENELARRHRQVSRDPNFSTPTLT